MLFGEVWRVVGGAGIGWFCRLVRLAACLW